MANVDTIDITKLILVEQGSTPSTPSAGKQKLFIRTSDHLLCTVDSSGTVTPWGGALTNPMTTAEDLIKGGSAGTPARLAKGSAGATLAMFNGAIAWNAGTSFPASPATNDRYYRTDLGLEAYYDGTRWLCACLHSANFNPLDSSAYGAGLSSSTNGIGHLVIGYPGTYTVWLVAVDYATQVNTTNDGTHFWTIQTASAPSNNTLGSSFTTASDTVATLTAHRVTVGAVVTSTDKWISYNATKTSTAGNLYCEAIAHFRYVLT